MASIVDESGMQVAPEGEIVLTAEQRSRTRDMILIRLRRMRVCWDDIGRIMNITADHARRHHNDIPENVRNYYGPLELG